MAIVYAFPHISPNEFGAACTHLLQSFSEKNALQSEWLSVDIIDSHIVYLRITKSLQSIPSAYIQPDIDTEDFEDEDQDDEALNPTSTPTATIEYDLVLSPTYRVPVLYFSIRDPQFRFPPTIDTLYHHIVPAQFRAQSENVGVIGGITITDHPDTCRPVFFIHPCQTETVLNASIGARSVTPDEYLLLWIGAMGKSVGLDVPLVLAKSAASEEGISNSKFPTSD